jgi:hypothetical protein
MNKRALISCLVTTLFFGICLGMLIVPHPHSVNPLFLIYGGFWAAFAAWYFYRAIPLNSRFPIRLWPVWAKVLWGILLGFAAVRLVHDVWSR